MAITQSVLVVSTGALIVGLETSFPMQNLRAHLHFPLGCSHDLIVCILLKSLPIIDNPRTT